MDKRLAKRHKRQVARAREKVRVSEPDVRTPEQIAAAKALSRPDLRRESHSWPTLPSDAAASVAAASGAVAPDNPEGAPPEPAVPPSKP
jgi:hypothetical protein